MYEGAVIGPSYGSALRVVVPTRLTIVRFMLVYVYIRDKSTKYPFLKVWFEVQKLWLTE